MKKLILALALAASLNVSCFAWAGVIGLMKPETKSEKALWITCSTLLICAGIHTMNKGKDDLTINMLGAGATAMGCCGFYLTFYEF